MIVQQLTEYSLRNAVISWLFAALLLIGGAVSFTKLGQLEFPEFPIPQAMVNTIYPGASPEQVEEEVTVPLERAIQKLEYVEDVRSISSAGVSQITVDLRDGFTSIQPQIWDELRRKVNDIQGELPSGVFPSEVNDDFSSVYGITYNITGPGYSYRDLENYADLLQRELSLVEGVGKVSVAGAVDEQVIIEISQEKMTSLNIDPSWIFGLLKNQNTVSNAGNMYIEGRSVRVHPTGEFSSVKELENMIIGPAGSSQVIRLGDIAKVYRDYDQTPLVVYSSNGEQALSLGISFAKGVNVVDVGAAVDIRLAELESKRPIGMKLTPVYNQPEVVSESIESFMVSLIQAIAVVIIVLLATMGFRSGVLMGGVLLLTISGTFIGMYILDVRIQNISLGALIIALGMLVDNAIVVTEGVLVGIQKGQTKRNSIYQVVQHNALPLLGATVIAIMAFAPIGLSKDTSGDFMRSLFQVLLISLSLSWILAVTLTPFFCNLMFDDPKEALTGEPTDPYRGFLFVIYRALLSKALKHRIITLILTIAALALAIVGFGHVKQAFFPPSNTPIFFVDLRTQEGSDIRFTQEMVRRVEKDVLQINGVKNITTVTGRGAQRFSLNYSPEQAYNSFGQLIVEAGSLQQVYGLIPQVRHILTGYPELEPHIKMLQTGPTPASNIEVRLYGPDPDVLRRLGDQAINIMRDEPTAISVKHSWREKTDIVRPVLNEAAARRSGISKTAIDEAILINFDGRQVGTYRDGSHLMPILARSADEDRLNADSLIDLQVWSAERNSFVPLSQVVSQFVTETENPLIVRRNRKRMLAVMADYDPLSHDTPEVVRQRLIHKIEAIELPEGYTMEWGGEYEMSSDARDSTMSSLPVGYLIMFLITVVLFSSIRKALSIWFTVPLAMIGIATGLLVFDLPFTFTALLGALSLSGMVVKNGIVLVEQIDIESQKEQSIQQSIQVACISRVRPVCNAALTTMLGMIPLVFDAFFSSLAVAVIFGLGFATVLTLIILPVLYSLLHRIRFS